MNKADVIDHVADAAGVAKQQAEGVLDAFFDTVKSAVGSGDRVAWPNFGAFSSTDRKARTGRNPRTGEAVQIPASKAIKFTPGSALKGYLNPKPPAGKKASGKKAAAGKAASKLSEPAKRGGTPKKAAAPKKAAPKAATAKKVASAKKATAKKR